MKKICILALVTSLASTTIALHAAPLDPIRDNCKITAGERPGSLRLETGDIACDGQNNCRHSMSDESTTRFTGISASDLSRQGAQLTATLAADAGNFTCSGTVQDGALTGKSVFTPNPAFVARMAQMGITGYDSNKLLAYTFLDVGSEWAQSIKDAGIRGLNADNLIALHIFHADPEYVKSMTALGYAIPNADELISLKVQRVDPAEVREIRALGYQPTLDELVQMRIFKITPDFIHRMEAHGLKDLTIAKLVQIRIFKLDE
jgi:hypothetical protein